MGLLSSNCNHGDSSHEEQGHAKRPLLAAAAAAAAPSCVPSTFKPPPPEFYKGLVLSRTRDACDRAKVPPELCSNIQSNNVVDLRRALQTVEANYDVLALAFRYASMLGDDDGMQAIAEKMTDQGWTVPEDAFAYARDNTAHAGLGGHTLAAVYARAVFRQRALARRAPSEVRIREEDNSDWKKCPAEGQELCGYIVNNDTQGLRQHIRYLRHQRVSSSSSGGGPPVQAVLNAALFYAAALGDDVGIQILAQEGAEITEDVVGVAANKDSTLPGVGGHTFAAKYLQALKDRQVSTYMPLTKLAFSA